MNATQLRKMHEGRERAQKHKDREAKARVKAWLAWSKAGGVGEMPTIEPGDERMMPR